MTEKIGFIGLGAMGRPMALNLLKAGHSLSVFARRPEVLQFFAAHGARVCASPAEVAQHSGTVFTMVTAAADVAQVVLGENGVIAGARAGSCVVDTSTI